MSDPDRLQKLENGLATLASQLSTFIEASETYRKDHRKDVDGLWQAIKEQSKEHAIALEKQGQALSDTITRIATRNELTMPKLIIIGTFLLSLGAAMVAVGHNFVLQGFEKVEIHRKEQQKEMDRHEQALTKLIEQQTQDSERYGAMRVMDLWLRDDVEAVKDDVMRHEDKYHLNK